MEKHELKEYAGQKADVVITKRDNGSVFVVFKKTDGYGYPTLELEQLQKLTQKCEAIKEAK